MTTTGQPPSVTRDDVLHYLVLLHLLVIHRHDHIIGPNPCLVRRAVDREFLHEHTILFVIHANSFLKPGETAKYPPVTVSEHYLGKLMRAGHSKVDAKAADALTH